MVIVWKNKKINDDIVCYSDIFSNSEFWDYVPEIIQTVYSSVE